MGHRRLLHRHLVWKVHWTESEFVPYQAGAILQGHQHDIEQQVVPEGGTDGITAIRDGNVIVLWVVVLCCICLWACATTRYKARALPTVSPSARVPQLAEPAKEIPVVEAPVETQASVPEAIKASALAPAETELEAGQGYGPILLGQQCQFCTNCGSHVASQACDSCIVCGKPVR